MTHEDMSKNEMQHGLKVFEFQFKIQLGYIKMLVSIWLIFFLRWLFNKLNLSFFSFRQ